jgi:hypothetical protein
METSRSQPATPQIEDPTEHRLSVLSLASSHHYNSASPHRPITVSSNSSIPTSADGHRSHGSLGESLNVASPQNASATEESRLDSQHKLEKSNTSLQSTSRERWQPVYLKKYRLVVFPLLFLSFIVTIQVLVRVSEVNNGLVTPSTKLHYLWTFGPMTTLTLAAALWARVEFQVKSVAPWAHMMDGQSGDKTLLLDYLAMLQPMAIVKAVKSRDWAVASASSCSLILRITIIFSTALIALAPTEVHDTVVPVPIHSSFLDSMAELENLATNVGSLPRYSSMSTTSILFFPKQLPNPRTEPPFPPKTVSCYSVPSTSP